MVLHINSPQSSSISITDNTEKESVDEIRQRIHSLRQMVEDEVGEKQNLDELKKSSKKRKESMDTGSLLSFTFGILKHMFYSSFNALNIFICRFYSISINCCRMLCVPIIIFSDNETLCHNAYNSMNNIRFSYFQY